nr:hypothetical protein [Tanacetum cinerariifolium]
MKEQSAVVEGEGRFTHAQLKSKSFEEIRKLYIKEHKWVDTFVPIGFEEDEKRVGSRKKRAAEGYDLILWGDLKTLMESSEDDEIWRNQQDWKLLSWSCLFWPKLCGSVSSPLKEDTIAHSGQFFPPLLLHPSIAKAVDVKMKNTVHLHRVCGFLDEALLSLPLSFRS